MIKSWVSSKDNFLNHDSQDVNFNVRPDPPFRRLLSGEPDEADPLFMGVEWEIFQYPERVRPSPGDRVSVFGFWILDCGHSPFRTEIHPPVGTAVHRPRPVKIPSDRQFQITVPGAGEVTTTVGSNVYVPGIVTEIWFNRRAGEITNNCSWTGLHQPAECNPACQPGQQGPGQQGCNPFIEHACIEGLNPIDRIFEFHIYLPKSPRAVQQERGLDGIDVNNDGFDDIIEVPLYYEVLNPFDHSGPEPEIIECPSDPSCQNDFGEEDCSDDDHTYLTVRIDLRNFTGDSYYRRIESAWVYPCDDNWGLER